MNEELINSAVSFLGDSNVSSSPLTKKVEFLESKGLNQQEIEEALRRANRQGSSSQESSNNTHQQVPQQSQAMVNQPPIDYYNVSPPQVPDRTWKDYFIMATATAGVTYGMYQVVSKYLIPSIIPPTQKSIDDDKAKIDEEFVKIDKLLEQMSIEQNEIKDSNEAKLKEVDIVIENVNDFLSKYNKDKMKFDDDLRLMKLEIDNLRNSIEKNMLLTKENIKDELSDITSELTSLKQLIKVRAEKSSSNDSNSLRKIAPVSSIPSASDILKKSKAGSSNTSNNTAKSTSPVSSPNSTTPPKTSANNSSNEKVNPTVSGVVSAAGIPDWQLKHKEQEKKQAEENDKPAIPAWQLHADAEKNADTLVNKSIANIGVPSWQLNTSSNSESKPESNADSKTSSTTDSESKNDAKESNNVPSWQSSASKENNSTSA